MKYIFFFCALVLVITSCKRTENNSNEMIRSLNPTIEPLSESPAYKKAEIIQLETSPSCFIANIKQVELNDTHIFVLDSNELLFSFTRDGKFAAKIGGKGEGPSEYIRLNTFYVDNSKKQLTIIDEYKNRLLRYDYNGTFLSATSVPENSFRWCDHALLTANNDLLTFAMMNMNDTKPYSLFSTKKNKVIEQYFSYEPITLEGYAYFFSAHPMAPSGEDIDVILPLCDTIYSYSPAKASFSAKYIIETPQKMIPKSKIRKPTPSYNEDINLLAEQGYFPGFTSIFETDTKVMLGYKYQGIGIAYFLFDKQSKSGNYHLTSWENETKTLPFFPIIQSFQNQFVGQASANNLIWLKNIEDPKIKRIIQSLKDDDNPCLILYTF